MLRLFRFGRAIDTAVAHAMRCVMLSTKQRRRWWPSGNVSNLCSASPLIYYLDICPICALHSVGEWRPTFTHERRETSPFSMGDSMYKQCTGDNWREYVARIISRFGDISARATHSPSACEPQRVGRFSRCFCSIQSLSISSR